MNKSDLISKVEHRQPLKNDSENTLRATLIGLHIFLDYLKGRIIKSQPSTHGSWCSLKDVKAI